MIAKDYHLIQEITKELELNDGKGFSVKYIKAVLDPQNIRKNADIELIASFINSATEESRRLLIKVYPQIKPGCQYRVPVTPNLIKS